MCFLLYNQSQFLLTAWNTTVHIFTSIYIYIYIYLFNSSFHKLQLLVQTCSTFKMFKKINGFNYFTRDFIISALTEFSFNAKLIIRIQFIVMRWTSVWRIVKSLWTISYLLNSLRDFTKIWSSCFSSLSLVSIRIIIYLALYLSGIAC